MALSKNFKKKIYIYIYIYGFLIIKNNNHVALELYLSIKFELCTVKLKTNN